jgi:murein DD-endopeptidase MepM/ murein hydrolase activator NlpD
MAKKLRYHFSPHDLKYIIHRPKSWEQVLKVSGLMASIFLVGLLAYSIFVFRTKTPDEKQLQHQISYYKRQVVYLNKKMERVNTSLAELQDKDNNLYRIIFEAAPLPSTVTNAATGGVDKYKMEEGIPGSEIITESSKKLDLLSSKLSVMSQSYKELMDLAKNKEKMLAAMPAIQPISNKTLKQMSSGFGMRLHPIYKTLQLHPGLDFTAAKGTPIYATGDGVIEGNDPNGAGYGLHVVINHGFGYQTLYGHMSKVLVRPGQKIKRGALIGLVGSTGLSTAPHVHYEVIKNGKKIDPINFFHNDLNSAEYAQIIQIAKSSNQSFD